MLLFGHKDDDGDSDTWSLCVFHLICSSIHDHTDSHCFMKLLQGQLKETLFHWPDTKSQGAMVQKSQRIIQENKVAYINGEEPDRVWIVVTGISLVLRRYRSVVEGSSGERDPSRRAASKA